MPTRSRENDRPDAAGGLLAHFAAQAWEQPPLFPGLDVDKHRAHPTDHHVDHHDDDDDDDSGIEVWDKEWSHHDRDECSRCHNAQGDDHGPQDCPYGGCDPGEHCPWECPYETGHTDWDKVHPHLGPAMHRGMSLHIPGLDHHAPPHEIAQHILGDFHHNVGTHWTDHHDQARHYAHVMARDGDNLHVVLHAKRPERDDIETDPHELLRGDAIGYGNHSDREIPIQENAHVHLTGISWKRPGTPEWHRHDFEQPMQHRAARSSPYDQLGYTDWDHHYPRLPGTIHRGMSVAVPGPSPSDHRDLARHIIAHLPGGTGTHWSTSEDQARRFAKRSYDPSIDTGQHLVVLHAATPERRHIETDPDQLDQQAVKGYDLAETEVPLRHGAPVRLTGVSWHDPRHGWDRHDFDEPIRHIAGAMKNLHMDTWLPHDRFFGPGKPGLDPRLFDGDHLKAAWRTQFLDLAARAFKRWPDWARWSRVYLAGSQASHWYGNNDLDLLIGVDYDKFRDGRARDERAGMSDAAIDEILNAAAHELCDPARYFDIDGKRRGPFDSTLYVNHDAYDIRDIKPYAAYDVSLDRWAVEPVEVPDDFGPDKLPSADFLYARSLADQVKALKKLPAEQAQGLGSALYDQLHGQRHEAFTGTGQGLYDPRNIAWKYLDQHPEHPMEQLVNWKRAAGQPMTITSAFERPTLPNPTADHESNSRAGHDDWFHATRYAFDHPEVNDAVEEDNTGRHWNTIMGTHWTGRHDVADAIGSDNLTNHEDYDDEGGDEDRHQDGHGSPRVFHARLHLKNPKRYNSEFDMDREVYGHEYDHGNQPSHHDEYHLDEWDGHPHLGHEDDLREGVREGHGDRRFADWIGAHPDRYNIGMRFKNRLREQGHDGIVYGNEFERARYSGQGHPSAIAFHPSQVEVTQTHRIGHPCLGGEELANFRHPRPGQPALPGMGPGLEHLAGKDGTSDADFAKTSMMIALVPPRTLADGLAGQVEDGEPATEMHVTLAYLPHVEPHDTGRIAGVVSEWASRHRPPVCRVQGVGTFVNIGNHPMWAAVDIPGSSRLHSTLVDALKAAGFVPAEDHGFTPHLTLKYQKHHVRFLPKIEPESFTCHTAWVCRGADWRPVPFGGATAK